MSDNPESTGSILEPFVVEFKHQMTRLKHWFADLFRR